MSLNNDIVLQKLQEKFGDAIVNVHQPYDMLTFETDSQLNLKVLQYLSQDTALGFTFLTDLTAVHYPDDKGRELAVVYHLHNFKENIRIRYKVFTNIEKPDVFTASRIFASANWQEREAYDFFGVNFVGHPDLRRIQNVEEMDYFPLRKEFPLEDQSRIDKDDEMFGRG